MQRWVGKSLKRKLSIILLGAILVPLLSLGYVLYSIAAIEAEERTKQSSLGLLDQIKTNLEFIVQDVENMSIFLIGQEDIQRYLASTNQGSGLQIKLMGFLSNFAFSKSYISNISIYPNNGSHTLSNTTIFNNGLFKDRNNTIIQQLHDKWWSSLYTNETTNGEEKVISFVRPIGSMTTYQPKGLLSISISEAAIAEFMMKPALISGESLLLVDRDQRMISGTMRDGLTQAVTHLLPGLDVLNMQEGQGFVTYGEGENKKTIVYAKVPHVDWLLLAVIPYAQYQAQNQYVVTVTAITVGLAMMIIAGIVLFLIIRVTRPLQTVAASLKGFRPDGEVIALPITSSDEIGMLVHSYNKLGERVHVLMQEVKRQESMKKEADMQALQAQINPHFLYNTLASIHWMALMNKDAKIAQMVGSLSDFLRFSLNKGSEYCQVKQEVLHVQHYSSIQQIRYPEQFEIAFHISSELESEHMLKLLLQPLIENAIIHGILGKQSKGCITVSAQLTQMGHMQFTIEDSGQGMSQEQLQTLLQQIEVPLDHTIKPASSYGLRNVNQRLLLHYGEESGLVIHSVEGRGTTISFTIPSIEKEEEGEGDEAAYRR